MLVVSHYTFMILLAKNYNYIFEFVKVMSKVLSVLFLSRVSTLTRDIDIGILSVCLSVCLSVRLSVCP